MIVFIFVDDDDDDDDFVHLLYRKDFVSYCMAMKMMMLHLVEDQGRFSFIPFFHS